MPRTPFIRRASAAASPLRAQERVVDAAHPWLGLAHFTERTSRFFFGRDSEVRELFLRVRDNTLTVLYGKSGLGKTSLLGAGLIPKLRAERFQPVLLRLRYEKKVPLLEQLKAAVATACTAESSDTAVLLKLWNCLTLWEIFHDIGVAQQCPAVTALPVLIIDQFEEVFTLGQVDEDSRRDVDTVITQLADLIENRPPAVVQNRLETDPASALLYDFTPASIRIILALREDYLASLEARKQALPSLMRNRLALEGLRGPAAVDAVFRPAQMDGLNLVSEADAKEIVRLVAKMPGSPLEAIMTVPPILSLICDELNRASPTGQISAAQYREQGDSITESFYQRSFEGLPDAVHDLVETKLVTAGGHRDSVDLAVAVAFLESSHVSDPSAALDALIDRRLVNVEEYHGRQRIEITHDLLLEVVRREGESRKTERRQRTLRIRLLWLASILAVTSAIAVGALVLYRTAERARSSEMEARQKEAEARTEAQRLVTFMLTDMQAPLGELGRVEMIAHVSEQARRYFARFPLSERDPEANRLYTQYLLGQARVATQRGRLSDAAVFAKQAVTNAQQTYLNQQISPTKSDVMRSASILQAEAFALLAETERKLGNSGPAWEAMRNAIALRQSIVNTDALNWTNHLSLALSFDEAARQFRVRGQIGEALQYWNESLRIKSICALNSPQNLSWQLATAASHEGVGVVMRSQGRRREARKSFDQSLAVRNGVAAKNPLNWMLFPPLAQSYELIAGEQLASGQIAAARTNLATSLKIRQNLVDHDPGNSIWQRDLAAALQGDWAMSIMVTNVLDALPYLDRSREILLDLTKRDTNNLTWQHDLARLEDTYGDVDRFQAKNTKSPLTHDGYMASAYQHYYASHALRARLAEIEPSNVEWQRGLAIAYGRFGEWFYDNRLWSEAQAYYYYSLQTRTRIASRDTGNLFWKHDLVIAYQKLGVNCSELKDLKSAVQHLRSSLSLAEALVAVDSTSWQWRSALAESRFRLATALLEPSAVGEHVKREATELLKSSRSLFIEIEQQSGLLPQQKKWLNSIERKLVSLGINSNGK